MGSSVILESAVSALFFLGCEVAIITPPDVMTPAASSVEQCFDTSAQNEYEKQFSGSVETACLAQSGKYQNRVASGDDLIDPIGPGGIYDPVFDGSRGGDTGAIGIAQPDPMAPSVLLTAHPALIEPGATAQLQWTATNVDRCTASGGWNGEKELSGSEATIEVVATTNFVLTCQVSGGTGVSNSAVVRVMNPDPAPEVTLTATPESVNGGSVATLSWTATNADTCAASDAWSGTRPTSGSESSSVLQQTSTFTLNCTGPGGTGGDAVVVSVDGAPAPPATFTKVTIDQNQAPWGKNFADLDGDGALDIVQGGGGQAPNVFWYKAPTWQKFQIGSFGGGDDLQTGDINGDGALDVVVNRNPVGWYENPMGSGGNPEGPWTLHTIGNGVSHDILLEDMNSDGKLDVVIRVAGNVNGSAQVILQGNTPDDWTFVLLHNDEIGTGGLAIADIDDDGRLDVVSDGYWLRQPAQNITNGSSWLRYDMGPWPAGSSIDTGDINGDGNIDVTLAVSEVGVGDLVWFEAPDDPLTQPWIRHMIGTVEDVHRHHLVDMNNDGSLDIVFAEMYQSATDRVGIYYNDGTNESWSLQIIENHGSHNIAVADIGNDGDMDILGANWQLAAPASGDVFLWINDIN